MDSSRLIQHEPENSTKAVVSNLKDFTNNLKTRISQWCQEHGQLTPDFYVLKNREQGLLERSMNQRYDNYVEKAKEEYRDLKETFQNQVKMQIDNFFLNTN